VKEAVSQLCSILNGVGDMFPMRSINKRFESALTRDLPTGRLALTGYDTLADARAYESQGLMRSHVLGTYNVYHTRACTTGKVQDQAAVDGSRMSIMHHATYKVSLILGTLSGQPNLKEVANPGDGLSPNGVANVTWERGSGSEHACRGPRVPHVRVNDKRDRYGSSPSVSSNSSSDGPPSRTTPASSDDIVT
jgi:hypothetical protein